MIEYRAPTPADAEALCAMARRSFVATFGTLYRPSDLAAFLDGRFGPAGLGAQIDDARFTIRIACAEDGIIGFAKLGPVGLPPPAVAEGAIELHQLYVLPEWHGRGVAAALMEWALSTARAAGKADLYLGVYVDNLRAQRFYARYGFVAIGRYLFPVGEHLDNEKILRLALGRPERKKTA